MQDSLNRKQIRYLMEMQRRQKLQWHRPMMSRSTNQSLTEGRSKSGEQMVSRQT